MSEFNLDDLQYLCAGAAVLASGGGGSCVDAMAILAELKASGWSRTVSVQAYDGSTSACVIAMMGSPDAGGSLTLTDIQQAAKNTTTLLGNATSYPVGCYAAVEIGAINSLVPMLAAAATGLWVVDGDGAGRAVPELPQTTFAGYPSALVSPTVLATADADISSLQSAVLGAPNPSRMQTLAGGVVGGFGGFSGIALWPSHAGNQFPLLGNYLPNTTTQTRDLGKILLSSKTPLSSASVADAISTITGQNANVIVENFYIAAVSQSTNSASLDSGIIQLDSTTTSGSNSDSRYIYNLNENLVMYSANSGNPDVLAPDSICYYSEQTGRGFSNATKDIEPFFDSKKNKSTGVPVSIIRVKAAEQLVKTPGVLASFASLLRLIGYAGCIQYV